ncbi:sortase [Phytomonospora endophytica]|uniref:LPXTG-site transpeptidase (Sortase) family protein n=1 Tax=Phytomonospora endophytica TaxID=714109 RepID=A0A841F683_9ACTN|nr:sortase [Phytomonospora endophytica]MBB6032441.1 LPXTG-site transpeptidase (sortase) family protein [Phytomonospora endophytica]GIG66412.1 sortase [Phytomonospora endophytica]
MTVTIERPPAESPAGSRRFRPPPVPAKVFGTVVTIVSALLLAFVAHLTVVSALRHDRAQQTAFADFRFELANGTAPVGQTDLDTGRLHEPGTPVAVLAVPSLGLREVVFEGTTSTVLTSGPGHRRDTELPGQAGTSVIYGRQATYGGPFARVAELAPGDVVNVATGQGEHAYRVSGVRRAGDPEPPALAPGAGRLTLVTADGPAFTPEGVVWVDADLTTPAQPVPPKPLAARALNTGEEAMAWETDSGPGLLLWGQTLLLAIGAVIWIRLRKGLWHAWIVGVPVLSAAGLTFFTELSRLLPNLL